MLSEVMEHFGLNREFRKSGYYETEHQKQMFKDIKATIYSGHLVALAGIIGCGKTTTLRRLFDVLEKEGKILVSKSLSVDKGRATLQTLIAALFYDLSTDKEIKIPLMGEKRERELRDLIKKGKKPVALFVDEAHDLHHNTLTGLKRLIEVVEDGGGILSVVLAGHPKLKNDLRRSTMEEIGYRVTVFSLEGLVGSQREYDVEQLSLFDLLADEASPVAEVHTSWDRAVEREKNSRTRFAQRSIKPEEVQQELIESDQILGTEQDVEEFVRAACERLNSSLIKQKQGWLLTNPPQCLQSVIGSQSRLLTFTTPAAEKVEYVGRNHPIVEKLARYLLESALENITDPIAARSGLTVTDAVEKRTTLLLLRLRHLLESSKHQDLLAEECLVVGFTNPPSNPIWLAPNEAISLLRTSQPVGDRPLAIKQIEVSELLGRIGELQPDLELFAKERSLALSQSHRRVRAITKEGQIKVKPQLPMDILGVYILQPGQRRTNT
ncbi:AAA ATPase [Crinalium epipsammum PCC 9333]|uniref:AAA ATPase n=1 Tax=Crinalium epipsammum PCC 9333 TaxID=1173022 RepID=K9VVD8_9CYAN|nr:AAA ATPase [Crinalium epipsammum PCC 9333]